MLFKGGGMSYLTQLKRCIIKVGICSIMLGLTCFIFANDTNDNLTVEYSASYGTLKVQAQTFYAGKEEGVNRIDYLVVEIFKNQLDNRVYYELFENHLIEDGWIKVVGWYDNEWGYSSKIIELIEHMNSVDKN